MISVTEGLRSCQNRRDSNSTNKWAEYSELRGLLRGGRLVISYLEKEEIKQTEYHASTDSRGYKRIYACYLRRRCVDKSNPLGEVGAWKSFRSWAKVTSTSHGYPLIPARPCSSLLIFIDASFMTLALSMRSRVPRRRADERMPSTYHPPLLHRLPHTSLAR